VIESWSSGPMLLPHNCTTSVEGLDPFINTGKGVSIFLNGSEKSVLKFGCICSLVRAELGDYTLFDFRVHRMINVFERTRGGNAFL
jgi:hypothetical protein